MLNLIHGFWTWVEFFYYFFIVKCSKIWNKIPYSYGTWKYSEKKKKHLFLKKKIILVGTFFSGQSCWGGTNNRLIRDLPRINCAIP